MGNKTTEFQAICASQPTLN